MSARHAAPPRPPGPRGHLLSGSLPELRHDVLGFFTRCAREHGDLSAFRFFNLRACLVNRPDLIQDVLVTQNERMRKAWDVRLLKTALGEGLLTSEGEAWRRHRRIIQPAFHGDRIRAYAGIIARRGAAAAEGWADGATVDVHAEMMRLTLEIVAEAIFGIEIAPHIPAAERAIQSLMESFEAMLTGTIPASLRWVTPLHVRARRESRRFDRILAQIIRQRRTDGTRGEGRGQAPRDDLLSTLLEAHDEEGLGLSDREIRDEMVTLLMAGHETTALALSWATYLLARHPEIEARLREEVVAALGDRLPTADDLPRLAYARQVVQESMRLYPPAWGIGRETLEDVELGGYRVRRRTQVFLVQWVTHRDPRFFPEPERFDPDRWSPGRVIEVPRFAYFPFGGGPRHCIGSGFAMTEATILLATLARRCRFELVGEHPIELQPAVTLRPRYGIRATVRRAG